MSANTSSQFDRLLKAFDAMVHKGIALMTGEETSPFQVSHRQWAKVSLTHHHRSANPPRLANTSDRT